MNHNYERFTNLEGQRQEPEMFERLKREEEFAAHLAGHVLKEITNGDPQEIARKILSLAQNDTIFARKISAKLEHLDDTAIEKVNLAIRTSGVLRPQDYFGERMRKAIPPKPPTKYERKLLHSVIPPDKQEELEPEKDAMVSYLSGNRTIIFSRAQAEVLEYLQGKKKFRQMTITKENSEEYLTAVKLWDYALAIARTRDENEIDFIHSSYRLRTHIAKIGGLPTNQSYTKTLDPKEYTNWDYLEKQSNWVPERALLHAKIIETGMIEAFALSNRLDTEHPSVWAVRGNTGSGKTYTLSQDSQFNRSLDDQGEPSGAINPDTFKAKLMRESKGLTHGQLHMEGSALSFQFAHALGREAVNATMIIDMRLVKQEQVQDEVIARAAIRKGDVLLMDLDTPFLTSVNRVLTRSPDGTDPIVPLISIRQGYEDARAERAKLLEEVKNNPAITCYKFYITDDTGEQKLAAKKENGAFTIIPGMEALVERAKTKPAAGEVDKMLSRVIDKEYIYEALKRDHINTNKIAMIQRWQSYTVREALDRHARGEEP